MAVEDKFVNADQAAGDKMSSTFGIGGQKTRINTEETAAADEDGSIYRFAKAVSVDEVITDLILENDVITGGTDFEIGIYVSGVGGAPLDIDLFLGTTSFASASTGFGVNGLGAVDIANKGLSIKDLYELVNATTLSESTVDIALTANTVGSGVGTVTMTIKSK